MKAQWMSSAVLAAVIGLAAQAPAWAQSKPGSSVPLPAKPPAALPAAGPALPQAPAQAPAVTPPATAAPAVVATWQEDAKAFVQALLVKLAAPGKDASLTAAQKEKALEAVLTKNLAVQRMGAILLGNNRTVATPAQLEEYNRLVPAYVARTFAERIDELVAQNLKMGATSARSAREVIVSTGFARKNNQGDVKVNWRTVKVGAGPIQVLDVSVNGVSPLIVQREEFTSIVKQKGFEGLLVRLRAN